MKASGGLDQMRVYFSCAAALVFAVALFAACNSNDSKAGARGNANTSIATDQHTPPDGIPRITPAELKAELDQGVAIVVDTRSPDAYNADHIKGAINIFDGNLDAHLKDLPTDKKIVAYCS
jgi:activator of HSP90 ATPase